MAQANPNQDDPQHHLAEAMMALATEMQQQRQQPGRGHPNLEPVKMPSYDGKTDVEDFIQLFRHLSDLYQWHPQLELAKLKTALHGKAAECARINAVQGIFTALRARFGITAAEAKRSRLAMKRGQNERLRDLADRIQKLIDLAYPELPEPIRATLARDQFKRCVNADLSLFMVSRPPQDLDDAVQLCSEYASAAAAPRTRRMNLNVAEVDPEPVSEPVTQQWMSDFMKTLVSTCVQAVQTQVTKPVPADTPKSQWKPPGSSPTQEPKSAAPSSQKKKRNPPGPCLCGQLHWYRDCPTGGRPVLQPTKARTPGNA